MIRMDLQRFGGRGGDSTSAAWMDGFFKGVKAGIEGEMKEKDQKKTDRLNKAKDELDGIRRIYKALKKQNKNGVVISGALDNERDMAVAWIGTFTKDTFSSAKYNHDTGRLTIPPDKMTQARRSFEKFAKEKLMEYYKKGRTRSKYGSYLKRFKLKK